MLGNEVTGHSVNTHGSLQPWPGGRLSHCSENGNVNKINLPGLLATVLVPLDEPGCSQQERDLETLSENQHKTSRTQTNKQTNIIQLKSGEKKKRGRLKFTAHQLSCC